MAEMAESKSPEWAMPCIRFLQYMFQVLDLIELTRRGTSTLTAIPHAFDVLAPTDHAFTSAVELAQARARHEKNLVDAKRMARLAESEIENDFPLLHSHALMGVWGALEGMVEDLVVSWLQHNPSTLHEPKLAKIRVPLVEFQAMGEKDRFRFLVAELQRDLGLELKSGATKFESLLTVLGLGGSVDKRVRDVIFEAQNLRNVLAHRAGVVDRKFLSAALISDTASAIP